MSLAGGILKSLFVWLIYELYLIYSVKRLVFEGKKSDVASKREVVEQIEMKGPQMWKHLKCEVFEMNIRLHISNPICLLHLLHNIFTVIVFIYFNIHKKP